jgi:mRNA interferase RelE/StbE
MPFELAFHPEALREWRKLTPGIREQFKNKLAERLHEPRIPVSKLRGSFNRYKIKLRAAGFRLVYEVLSIAKPISADTLWLTPCPRRWISCAGRTHA